MPAKELRAISVPIVLVLKKLRVKMATVSSSRSYTSDLLDPSSSDIAPALLTLKPKLVLGSTSKSRVVEQCFSGLVFFTPMVPVSSSTPVPGPSSAPKRMLAVMADMHLPAFEQSLDLTGSC